MRAWMLALVLVVSGMVAHWAAGQDTVRLRQTVRIDSGVPLLLGDIAEITGPSADELRALVVAAKPESERAGPGGWISIPISRVEAMLTGHLGERAGLVVRSGATCEVRVRGSVAAPPPRSETAPAVSIVPTAEVFASEDTVRGAIAREMAGMLGTAPADLRLTFEERDLGAARRSTEGLVVEIVATGSSSRMPVSVRLYDQGRVVLDRTVRVEVEVRRTIAVAGRVIERGASIGAGDIAPDTRWVPPGTGAVEPGTAAGSVAKRRMEPGEVVEAHLITPPTMIERGDEVVVRVVTGGFVVSRVAYALEDGVEGDRIELAAKTDPSLTLRAEVTGRGQALIRQGGAPAAGGTGIAISVDRR